MRLDRDSEQHDALCHWLRLRGWIIVRGGTFSMPEAEHPATRQLLRLDDALIEQLLIDVEPAWKMAGRPR